MHPNVLQTPITYLKGVGPGRADMLGRELGIDTYQDLLYHFPHRYIDKSRFYNMAYRTLVDRKLVEYYYINEGPIGNFQPLQSGWVQLLI